MTHASIRFYFDFISPYAYLAWTQIQALATRVNATVEPVPILFAALLNAHGQKGPAEIPPKRIYLFKDVYRRAHRFGVPLVPPPHHPFNPLLALRVASVPQAAGERNRMIDGLFAAAWGEGSGIEHQEQVAEVVRRLGMNAPQLLDAATSTEVKNRLRQQTDEALQVGAFGVPTMIVGDELFWGADALEPLEAFIKGEDPLQKTGAKELARWMSIEPSAVRR